MNKCNNKGGNKANRMKKFQSGGASGGHGAANQFGVFQDPAATPGNIDPFLNAYKSAGAAFLGDRTSALAYFNWLAGDDPAAQKQAANKANRSAFITGATAGLSSIAAEFGQRRDYADEMQRVARLQADEYYRVPFDRYGYNSFAQNEYNATAYKMGGQIKRYQDGGSVDGEVAPPNRVREQVVFDSIVPEEGYNSYNDFNNFNQDPFFPFPGADQSAVDALNIPWSYEPEDDIPTDGNGMVDPSKFIPTFGGMPIRYATTTSDVESVISQIGQHESGGNYAAVNTSGGENAINATGKYQFVPKYWHKEIAKFQGTEGKSMDETMDVFKNNPKTQEAFMRHVVQKYYMPEMRTLLPLAKQYGIDQAGLIKMLHYRGIEDTRNRLRTGNFEVSKREKELYNNPDILSYVRGGR